MRGKLLIMDDEKQIRVALNRLLKDNWDVMPVSNSQETLVSLDFVGADVALIDWLPYGENTAQHCIKYGVPFVVLTGSPQLVPESIREDHAVLTKPATKEEIEHALHNAIGR